MDINEPIGCLPNLVCLTCGMSMEVEGRVSLTGTVWVRYPCDSCKGSGRFKIEIPVVKPLERQFDNEADSRAD